MPTRNVNLAAEQDAFGEEIVRAQIKVGLEALECGTLPTILDPYWSFAGGNLSSRLGFLSTTILLINAPGLDGCQSGFRKGCKSCGPKCDQTDLMGWTASTPA
jgi:hypothetical protein